MPVVSQWYFDGEISYTEYGKWWSRMPQSRILRRALHFCHPDDRVTVVSSLTGETVKVLQEGDIAKVWEVEDAA